MSLFHYIVEKRIGANCGNVLISSVKLTVKGNNEHIYLTDWCPPPGRELSDPELSNSINNYPSDYVF